MLQKYLLAIALISGCFLITSLAPRKIQDVSSMSSTYADLVLARKALHDDALAEIKNDFKISDADWIRYLSAFEQVVETDNLLGTAKKNRDNNDPWIIQKINEIFTEYGVNPERVIIKRVTTGQARAIQDIDNNGRVIHTLEINVDWFSTYSQAAQEGFARHEIMHLVNYDCLEENYILGLLEELELYEEKYNSEPSIINYRQQREIRADLLAACGHANIAQEMQKFFSQCAIKSENYKPQTWHTHPRDIIRAQKLAQLLTKMDAPSVTV